MINFLKEKYAELLHEFLPQKSIDDIKSLIEISPENISGDLAFPCFILTKDLKKSPNEIAWDLVKSEKWRVKNYPMFDVLEAFGAYVNVHVSVSFLAGKLLPEIFDKKEKFAKWEKKKELILIESPGPNTNKPLHLGHVRNLLLWNSVENIARFAGFKVKRIDIVNDRWIHICKSMLAYKMFWKNKDPDKKSDHFVGDRYVKYATEVKNNPEMEKNIKQMLVDWEDEDPDIRRLWSKMNRWALSWHEVTYERYWTKIEKAYLESDHYKKWKWFVEKWLEKWIFEKNDKWNIICNMEDLHLWKKTILRSDGTSIYITQDLALAELRYNDFKMDRMVYVVWNEQKDHFRSLFEILRRMEFPFAEKLYHLSYGMISLPSGKMKSREWTVVDADNLADDMHLESKKLLIERYTELSENELDEKAEIIAMAAIKFFILKYETEKDFVFDPVESLSFEWETGPYLQYSYARISSIINKANSEELISNRLKQQLDVGFSLLKEKEEKALLLKLAEFGSVIEKAGEEYKPNLLVRWCLELAKLFNNYYQKHKILWDDEDLQNVRLFLINSVASVLKQWLNLLWIDVLEKM